MSVVAGLGLTGVALNNSLVEVMFCRALELVDTVSNPTMGFSMIDIIKIKNWTGNINKRYIKT